MRNRFIVRPVNQLSAFVHASREHGLVPGGSKLEQHGSRGVRKLIGIRGRIANEKPVRTRFRVTAEAERSRQKMRREADRLLTIQVDVEKAAAGYS
jgi:hypothetical protein